MMQQSSSMRDWSITKRSRRSNVDLHPHRTTAPGRFLSFIDHLPMGRRVRHPRPCVFGVRSPCSSLHAPRAQAHRRYCLEKSVCAFGSARSVTSMSHPGGLPGLLLPAVVAYTRTYTFRGLGCSFDAMQCCRRPIEASDWRYHGRRRSYLLPELIWNRRSRRSSSCCKPVKSKSALPICSKP